MKKPPTKTVNAKSIDFSTHLPARLSRLSNRLEAFSSKTYVENFGIGMRGWKVLAALGRYGRLSINQIAEYHGTAQSSISRAVQELGRRGLVKRAKSKTDGRQVLVTLTRKGEKAHDAIVPISRLRAKELLQTFSPEERRTIDRLLTKLQAKVDDMIRSGSEAGLVARVRGKTGGKAPRP